ncbi:MAG: hypothetical protein R3D25_10225 [Geminicoccaceae bacterium]
MRGRLGKHRCEEGLMKLPDRVRKSLAGIVVLACAAHLAAPSAYGCAFHNTLPDVQLDGMHRGSLAVAVALRRAADREVIDAAALEGSRRVITSYIDAVRRLQALGQALAASPAAAALPASFSLGFVESRLWTRYSRSGGAIRTEVHTDGPADGEPVVLTGEPVVTELLAGTLSIADALAEGLIVIDASGSETAAIHQAFLAASPARRVSSR